MRKIEEDMVTAIFARKDWRCKNTEVAVTDETVNVYLHGNRIARYWIASGVLDMTLCGWPTVTTRSRLNAITWALMKCKGFYQCNHQQYWNGRPITNDEIVSIACK